MKRDMQKYGATYYSSRNQMKCTLEVYSHIQTLQNLKLQRKLWYPRSFDEIFKIGPSIRLVSLKVLKYVFSLLELVTTELNHFCRQIGGHRSRFVLFCSFWRLFTIKKIKSVKVFPFSFWKIITIFIFFYFIKFIPLS